MAMISCLLMIGENTERLQWIQSTLADYFQNIAYRAGETPEEKKSRIFGIANPALLAMITYLKEISLFRACSEVMNDDEQYIIDAWLTGAYDLFPKNNRYRGDNEKDSHKHENDMPVAAAAAAAEGGYSESMFLDEEAFPPPAPVVRAKAAADTPKKAKPQGAWGLNKKVESTA